MPTAERNFLIVMFFVTLACSALLFAGALGWIKTKKSRAPNLDYRDASLGAMGICGIIQSAHYWIQAHAITFDAGWVAIVRFASVLLLVFAVIYVINGRISAALSTAEEKLKTWIMKFCCSLVR